MQKTKFLTLMTNPVMLRTEPGSFMMQNTGSVENKSDDGGDKFIDVADLSEKRERAKTPTTVQRERVHEAFVVQEDADQEDREDHVVAASQDKGDKAAKVSDVGIQTRQGSLRMLDI